MVNQNFEKSIDGFHFFTGFSESFDPEDVSNFRKIVLSANQVQNESFERLLSENPIITLCKNSSGEIVATGALKIPSLGYKRKIFSQSKTNYDPNKFIYELGWIVSLRENLGLATSVIKHLIMFSPNQSIYGTSHLANDKIHHVLEKFLFKKSGYPYKSNRGNYQNILFVNPD